MEDLLGWANEVALRPAAPRPDDILHLAGAEVAFSISAHHGLYSVQAEVPGDDRIVLAVFEDVDDARRLVAMQLGALGRREERMPRLTASTLPPGFVIEVAPTSLWLTWLTGSAEFPPLEAARTRALNFSRVERAPLTQIRESFLDPGGRPLYAAA